MYRFRIVLFVLLIVSLAYPSPQPLQAAGDAAWLLSAINCLRQSVGAAPLALNPSLNTSATQHSTFLASNNNWSDFHTEPDGSTPKSRAQAAGFGGYVGENVVGSSSVQAAYNWWVNDDIHYRNMINLYWESVGVGIGSGPNGTWYTLDFGAMSWQANRVPAVPCGSNGPANPVSTAAGAAKQGGKVAPAKQNTAKPQQPAFVAGVDERGNIKHRIQPGDTLGNILVIYGYTWDDMPAILTLNGITQADFRNLKIGDILLIPPKKGTYTPAAQAAQPSALPANTAIPAATGTQKARKTLVPATTTLTPTPTVEPTNVGAIVLVITATPRAEGVALVPTEAAIAPPSPIRNILPWAIVLQVVVVGGLIAGSVIRRRR